MRNYTHEWTLLSGKAALLYGALAIVGLAALGMSTGNALVTAMAVASAASAYCAQYALLTGPRWASSMFHAASAAAWLAGMIANFI